jgi:HPt (histidine-containing phosphotransfer) domain-containing protein
LFARICKTNFKHAFEIPDYIEGNTILSGSDLSIFDTQFAINQFSGNQLLLVKILEKFILQYQNFDTLIAEQLQQEDLHEAKKQVHTIKGVSGNLGMKALFGACKELEVNLDSQVTEHTLQEFLNIFKQTLTLVQKYSAENGNQESPAAAPQADDKTALIAALKRNEFISESKMQSYSQALSLSAEKLNELKQAIDDLDYPSAIELLE